MPQQSYPLAFGESSTLTQGLGYSHLLSEGPMLMLSQGTHLLTLIINNRMFDSKYSSPNPVLPNIVLS